jgi:hypothetical protein
VDVTPGLSSPRRRARAQVAAEAKVSEQKVRDAVEVKKADPGLCQQVAEGKVSLRKAKQQVRGKNAAPQKPGGSLASALATGLDAALAADKPPDKTDAPAPPAVIPEKPSNETATATPAPAPPEALAPAAGPELAGEKIVREVTLRVNSSIQEAGKKKPLLDNFRLWAAQIEDIIKGRPPRNGLSV